MSHRRLTAGLVAAAAMALAGPASSALAQATTEPAPSFSRCPVAKSTVVTCLVIKSTDGYMKIKDTTVPLGDSIRIDGGIELPADGSDPRFVPPATGSALTGTAVTVPGGLLGIPLPLGWDTVKATAQQVGPASMDWLTFDFSVPIRIKLDNPLLGSGCAIGSSLFPIRLRLTTGTTNPPLPNTPITGKFGEFVMLDETTGLIKDNIRVDNSFSVPIALNCGYLTGILVTTAVNLKLGLPSAAGRNTMSVTDNFYVKEAANVRAGL